MTQSPQAASGKAAKLNRVERNAWTKQRIFEAATRIVGKYGYAEASVARITEQAGVAQGTFYNHFENRQELLDQLLPKIGIDMIHFIRARTGTAHAARQEIERFGAFFDFIREVPEFLRILNEAEYSQARPAGRRDRGFQRRGIRSHRPHVHGRAGLSQPALLLCGRHGDNSTRSRHFRLPETGHARAVRTGQG